MTGYNLAGNAAGPFLRAEPISPEVRSARLALAEGLALLRGSLGDMLSVAMRGDGSTGSRTRNRPPINDAPTRHVPGGVPGGNARPPAGRGRQIPAQAPDSGAAGE